MNESEQQMQETIGKLFVNDLELLKDGVPTNGIWTVCRFQETDYHGAVRVVPSEFGSREYSLWIDVFRTIYDPIYSNSLFKGSIEEIRAWLKDKGNIGDVYACMCRLHELAEDE